LKHASTMGVLEGCDRFLKYIFFFFTFVLWLLGLCAIVIGIWAYADDKSFTDIISANVPALDELAGAIHKAAILLIIVGVGIMIIGFLGCCGAAKENQCLLSFFFLSQLLIFILMIAGAVMAYGYKDKLGEVVAKGLAELKKDYETNADAKKSLDNIQETFKCCEFSEARNETIPDSCRPEVPTVAPAPTAAGNATVAPVPKPKPYDTTCDKGFMTWLDEKLDHYQLRIVGVGVASAVIIVLGMIVSMALCCKIRRGYAEV